MGAGSGGARGLHARHQSEQLGFAFKPSRTMEERRGGGEERVEGRGGGEGSVLGHRLSGAVSLENPRFPAAINKLGTPS